MSEQSLETTETLLTDEPQARSKPVNTKLAIGDELESLEATVKPLHRLRAQAEIRGIRYALKLTGWNRKQAARLLKISYRGLLYKIRQHNITQQVSNSE